MTQTDYDPALYDPDDEPAPDDANRYRPADAVLAAERQIAGAAITSNRLADTAAARLTPADFWDTELAVIFQAATELSGTGKPISETTVLHHLTVTGQLSLLRRHGIRLLGDLAAGLVIHHPATVEYHAAIVADDAHRRAMHAACTSAAQFTGSPEFAREDTDLVLDRIQRAALQVRGGDDEPMWAGDDIDDSIDAIEQRDNSRRIPTPWSDINTGVSLGVGQLVIIAARPGMGKSIVGLNLATEAASRGEGVLFASMEMGRGEVHRRMISSLGRVHLDRLEHNTLTDEDWSTVAQVQPQIKASGLLIDDGTDCTPARLRARLRYMRTRMPTRLVVIDYLQLMRGSTRERRDLEVADITRSLKIMAKTEQVCMVVLCQLNRGPEQRADKRPMPSDLRESGAIEQDADTVILLHRPDAYEDDCPRAGEIDLIVAKQRSGPRFTATAAFQGHYARVVDMGTPR